MRKGPGMSGKFCHGGYIGCPCHFPQRSPKCGWFERSLETDRFSPTGRGKGVEAPGVARLMTVCGDSDEGKEVEAFNGMTKAILPASTFPKIAGHAKETIQWENALRDVATDALIPVLYPSFAQPKNGTISSGLDTEKCLKKCLRWFEQSLKEQCGATVARELTVGKTVFVPAQNREMRQATRRRLSDLILGTSIMRLRHWFVLNQRLLGLANDKNGVLDQLEGRLSGDMAQWLVSNPIYGVSETGLDLTRLMEDCLELSPTEQGASEFIAMSTDAKSDARVAPVEAKLRFRAVRALVDLHADFLLWREVAPLEIDTSPTEYIPVNEKSNKEEDIHWPTNPIERISVQNSLPSFVVQLWIEKFGLFDAEELAAQCNRPGPITLRRNALRCQSDEELCARLLEEENVHAVPLRDLSLTDSAVGCKGGNGVLSARDFLDANSKRVDSTSAALASFPPSLPAPAGCIRLLRRPQHKSIWSWATWKEGCCEVQDAGSQLIVAATEAKAGDTVVDFCAGNGGKTLALASKMWESNLITNGRGGGQILAHDIVKSRLRQLQGRIGRAGLDSAHLKGGNIVIDTTVHSNDALSDAMADIVLVDAPCSSLGVLRRRPSHRWALTEGQVRCELPRVQLEILNEAARLVKEGGCLVYATCSTCQTENEEIVDQFESFEGFSNKWERWNFVDFDQSRDSERAHCRSLLPHLHDTDGFFIARWKRQ